MRIHFERSGGITGMRVTTTVDTDLLPEDEAQELRDMLDAANFFELPERLASPAPGADRFQYRLTVENDDQEPHTVHMGDASAPPEMQPLLRKLTLLARGQRDSDSSSPANPGPVGPDVSGTPAQS